MHPRMDGPTELLKMGEAIPKDMRMELKNLDTLEDAWVFLNSKFSDQDRLTTESLLLTCFPVYGEVRYS